MRKLKRQLRYEEMSKRPVTDVSAITVSNGFRGANVADMMIKRNRTTCAKKHRFAACTKCSGCRTANCGICRNCEDMPAFGGAGTSKQKCLKRVCTNPIMRSCAYCQWDIEKL